MLHDPITKAFNIDITYQYEHDKHANWYVPRDEIQMLPDPFSKAHSFGLTLSLGEKLSLVSEGALLGEKLFKVDDIALKIPLGIKLKVPPGIAFIHHGLINNTVDYVMDKQGNEFYPVRLYFNKQLDVGATWEAGTPVIKILPLPNERYSFKYRSING